MRKLIRLRFGAKNVARSTIVSWRRKRRLRSSSISRSSLLVKTGMGFSPMVLKIKRQSKRGSSSKKTSRVWIIIEKILRWSQVQFREVINMVVALIKYSKWIV